MAHARQQLREAFATAVTGLTTTTGSVYQSRVYPHDTLPCLTVYTIREDQAPEETLGDSRFRLLSVACEARARAASDFDDTIDDICAEVEAAIFADPTLGGLSVEIELEGTEIELSAEAEQPTGVAIMDFKLLYRVDRTDAETIIS